MKGNVLLLYPLFIFVYLLITIQFFKHPESDEIAKITNTFISDMKKAEEYAKNNSISFCRMLNSSCNSTEDALKEFRKWEEKIFTEQRIPKKVYEECVKMVNKMEKALGKKLNVSLPEYCSRNAQLSLFSAEVSLYMFYITKHIKSEITNNTNIVPEVKLSSVALLYAAEITHGFFMNSYISLAIQKNGTKAYKRLAKVNEKLEKMIEKVAKRKKKNIASREFLLRILQALSELKLLKPFVYYESVELEAKNLFYRAGMFLYNFSLETRSKVLKFYGLSNAYVLLSCCDYITVFGNITKYGECATEKESEIRALLL